MMWIVPSIKCGIIIVFGFHSIVATPTLSVLPSDHLVPPLPANKSQDRYNAQLAEEPSFMGRIANWFGFGNNLATDDSVSSKNEIIANPNESTQYYSDQQESSNSDIQQRYYDQPSTYTTASGRKVKITCNPCNKVPWTPMIGSQQQLPYFKTQNSNTDYAVQYQHVPVQKFQYQPEPNTYKMPLPVHNHASYSTYSNNYYPQLYNNHQNRPQILIPTYASGKLYPTRSAVHKNRITSPEYKPPPQLLPVQDTNRHLIPIPIPNLSITPIPPIFSSKPFRNINKFNTNSNDLHHTYSQNENGAKLPGSIQDLLPAQPPTDSYGASAISDSDIEIIRSVSLGEYTSAIEYPAAIVQSPVIDLTETRLSPKNIFATTASSHLQYITEPIVVEAEDSLSVIDNYPAASSINRTEVDDEINDSDYIVNFSTTSEQEYVAESTITPITFVDQNKQKNITQAKIKNINKINLSRNTPKKLLDTYISYLKTTSSPSMDQNLSTLPKFDYRSWQPSTLHGLWTPTTIARPFTSGTNTSVYSKTLENDSTSNLSSIDKKPKQIQIIIPYTTKNQPRPFKKIQNFDSTSGWSYQTNDFHDSQESKVVESTISTQRPLPFSPSPQRRTTKYLTKVRASNLRELLANEGKTKVDLSKLQKSIDGWTEQEFSMLLNRGSTISLRAQPKVIPSEYFTSTLPSIFKHVTTEILPDTVTSVAQFNKNKQGNELETFKAKLLDKSLLGEGFTQETAIRLAKSNRGTVSNLKKSFWNDLKTVILPITKEKVYVVTPQPWIHNQDSDSIGNFKSPRFSVRPTPGSSAEIKSIVSEKEHKKTL